MNQIYLQIYIGLNLFFAGYYLGDNFSLNRAREDQLSCIFIVICTILFGSIYIPLAIISGVLTGFYMDLNKRYLLDFWFIFYLTKKLDNIDPYQLKIKNRIVRNHHNTNSLTDRLMRYAIGLINQRNKYVYDSLNDHDYNNL